ncbi:AbrB family transcriptional regulator [Murinocardiopsis flavida]|uniref:AbrB family transcriptional regulator n=1 Tax=Murinocardiopsis flavida TaxID=645275 RepID=A0A2P8DMU4_9ACTN|nr:AbrB/MazE/SpoVT family DNA-binding domain-containing protein [Murinocardiopsis flavida]PSK98532.1 AbrB family transcriptional regulator [Murinocardiopsis flavida]
MDTKRRRAVIRHKNQITLPKDVSAALHIGEGDEVEFAIGEHGEVSLRGLAPIPADQRWFWDADWQAGEREAEAQIAAGRTTVFDDAEAMFDEAEEER